MRIAALMIILAMSSATAGHAQDHAALPGWMAGCWLTDPAGGPRSEECWTAPRGAMMLGSGHMFEGGKTLSFEHMRIEREGPSLVFVGQPGGATPTRFALEMQRPNEVRFLNEAHDYPQRITYRLVNDVLEAEVAMKDGTGSMRWTFRRP